MFRQHRAIACLGAPVSLLMLVLVLAGCGDRGPAPTPPPTPGTIAGAATPVVTILRNPNVTEVPAGGQVAIAAEATGRNLTITWSPKRGKVSNPEGPSTIYTAPDVPGIDTVDVIATSDGGTTTKTVTFTVLAPPTETPTATLALTKTPTPTPTMAMPMEPLDSFPCSVPGPALPGTQIDGEARITGGLQNGQTIDRNTATLAGSNSGVPDNIHLWVLVYPHVTGGYYPQNLRERIGPVTITRPNGNWQERVQLGNPPPPEGDSAGAGECFDVVVVLADEAANREFIDYHEQSSEVNDWKPIEPGDLPGGIKEVHRITVFREE